MERMGATSSREAIRIPISQMQAVSSRAHVGSPLALPWPKTCGERGHQGPATPAQHSSVRGSSGQPSPGPPVRPALPGTSARCTGAARAPREPSWRWQDPLPPRSLLTPGPSLQPEQPPPPRDPQPGTSPGSAWPQPGAEPLALRLRGSREGPGAELGTGRVSGCVSGCGQHERAAARAEAGRRRREDKISPLFPGGSCRVGFGERRL